MFPLRSLMQEVLLAHMVCNIDWQNHLPAVMPCAGNRAPVPLHTMCKFEMRSHGFATDYQRAVFPSARSATPASVVLRVSVRPPYISLS